MTALREGRVERVLALVERLPASSNRILRASARRTIALEALKREMVAQMGPEDPRDEAWRFGQPSDHLIDRLDVKAHDQGWVVLEAEDPPATAGWMVWRGGAWVVPAAMVIDVPPGPYVEPSARRRAEILRYEEAVTRATEAVLKRLRSKELKTAAEVQAALGGELVKVHEGLFGRGQVDDR